MTEKLKELVYDSICVVSYRIQELARLANDWAFDKKIGMWYDKDWRSDKFDNEFEM